MGTEGERKVVKEDKESERAIEWREKEEEKEEELKPWEQHSAVISIPRFDYSAPSALLHHSHSGFLITCPIKREKSATKEVMSLLDKYVRSVKNTSSERLENSVTESDTKRQKICMDESNDQKGANSTDTSSSANGGTLHKNTTESHIDVGSGHVLSLVKLTRSGLLLFTFPRNSSIDTVHIVSDILRSLENGSMKSPVWCHRIFPIQATCVLNEKNLRDIVSKLVSQFVGGQHKQSEPLKFAIGYNKRGVEETELKNLQESAYDTHLYAMLDRSKCFSTVAGAIKGVAPASVVDLKSPDLSVLVELLPLSGVPNGSLVVAVSVLPRNLVGTKPQLCMKALVADKKGRS